MSNFLVSHIAHNYLPEGSVSILEPSVGDGVFINSLARSVNFENRPNSSIDILDINNAELQNAREKTPKHPNAKITCLHSDYLKFYLNGNKKYSLIIGNPPYIEKKLLGDEVISDCELIRKEIYKKHDINSKKSIKNIWPAFVEANILSLKENGILCLVIPAEVLQVIHTKDLRTIVSKEFDRVEIFSFNELIFNGIQQDVVALIGVKGLRNEIQHGFSFYHVDKLEDLKEPRFTEKNNNVHRTTLDKWTNYILTDEELNFVDENKNNFSSINSYCVKAEVGIVSAANDYFILSDTDVQKNKLNRLKGVIHPILPKGYALPNTNSLSTEDFTLLKGANKRINFLCFPDVPKYKLGKIANDYLTLGEEKDLHTRFKMKKRRNWYHIPSVWKSEALFVKRSHIYPKFFVNEANVLATDSFYRVNTKDCYDTKKLVFSFYNSLTFVLAELEGRFYGGGVLELTPNEFKNLAIPYTDEITDKQFQVLESMLRADTNIDQILMYTNSILLPDVDVSRLEGIREKLVLRRLKSECTSAEVISLEKVEIEESQLAVAIG